MHSNIKCVNVAIVGTGNVAGAVHILAWKKIKEANLIAVCDIDKECAENVARKWKIPHIYTDFAELLDKEEGAIIDICALHRLPTHPYA